MPVSITDLIESRGYGKPKPAPPKNFTEAVIAQGVRTQSVYSGAAPESAASLKKALQWLRDGKIYRVAIPLIPHGLEERWLALKERYAHAVAVTPPSKFVVVEYEHGGAYRMGSDLTRALSTKRVALCVDLESVQGVTVKGIRDFVRAPDDAGGLLVWPINYFDEKRDWEFAAAAVIIPRHGCAMYVESEKIPSTFVEKLMSRFATAEPTVGGGEPIEASFLEMLPEICSKLEATDREGIYTNTAMDAIWAVLGTLSALQCSNVSADEDGRLWLARADGPGDAARVSLDPFHGKRVSHVGGALWEQESTRSF